jgi:SAM-dependent methyltransferase
MDQIKSRERVIQYGEVFTPLPIVEAMLGLIETETAKVDSRFLEPACGSGNFLVEILRRKLNLVQKKFTFSEWEREQHSMLALMCVYGIDILPDNVSACRENLLRVVQEYPYLRDSDDFIDAAIYVLSLNIVQGDAMKKLGEPLKGHKIVQGVVLPEWGYLSGTFHQRDWDLKVLENKNRHKEEVRQDPAQLTLIGFVPDFDAKKVFKPIKDDYPPATILDLAKKSRLKE